MKNALLLISIFSLIFYQTPVIASNQNHHETNIRSVIGSGYKVEKYNEEIILITSCQKIEFIEVNGGNLTVEEVCDLDSQKAYLTSNIEEVIASEYRWGTGKIAAYITAIVAGTFLGYVVAISDGLGTAAAAIKNPLFIAIGVLPFSAGNAAGWTAVGHTMAGITSFAQPTLLLFLMSRINVFNPFHNFRKARTLRNILNVAESNDSNEIINFMKEIFDDSYDKYTKPIPICPSENIGSIDEIECLVVNRN